MVQTTLIKPLEDLLVRLCSERMTARLVDDFRLSLDVDPRIEDFATGLIAVRLCHYKKKEILCLNNRYWGKVETPRVSFASVVCLEFSFPL